MITGGLRLSDTSHLCPLGSGAKNGHLITMEHLSNWNYCKLFTIFTRSFSVGHLHFPCFRTEYRFASLATSVGCGKKLTTPSNLIRHQRVHLTAESQLPSSSTATHLTGNSPPDTIVDISHEDSYTLPLSNAPVVNTPSSVLEEHMPFALQTRNANIRDKISTYVSVFSGDLPRHLERVTGMMSGQLYLPTPSRGSLAPPSMPPPCSQAAITPGISYTGPSSSSSPSSPPPTTSSPSTGQTPSSPVRDFPITLEDVDSGLQRSVQSSESVNTPPSSSKMVDSSTQTEGEFRCNNCLTEGKFRCNICFKSARDSRDLRRHYKDMHEPRWAWNSSIDFCSTILTKIWTLLSLLLYRN